MTETTPRYLAMADIARRCGLAPSTVRTYRLRGELPEPDAWIGDTPGWTVDTIDRYRLTLPGQGARTDLRTLRDMGHPDGLLVQLDRHRADLDQIGVHVDLQDLVTALYNQVGEMLADRDPLDVVDGPWPHVNDLRNWQRAYQTKRPDDPALPVLDQIIGLMRAWYDAEVPPEARTLPMG